MGLVDFHLETGVAVEHLGVSIRRQEFNQVDAVGKTAFETAKVSGPFVPDLVHHSCRSDTTLYEAITVSVFDGEHLRIVDQAALYGLLAKLRNLALPLISVNRVEEQADT